MRFLHGSVSARGPALGLLFSPVSVLLTRRPLCFLSLPRLIASDNQATYHPHAANYLIPMPEDPMRMTKVCVLFFFVPVVAWSIPWMMKTRAV